MNLKPFLLALTVAAMFAAVLANGASAAMTAEGEWYVEGSTLLWPEVAKCEIGGPNKENKFVLTGMVGTTPTKLTATGVECLNAEIKNEAGHGLARGRLLFSGITVSEPTGCVVPGGTVTTETLKSELYMDSGSPANSHAFEKFESAEAGVSIATVEITGTCAAAGHRVIKGNVFGEMMNPTGASAKVQPLTFNSTVEATSGSALTFAGNVAHLAGQINMRLAQNLPEEEYFQAK